MSAVDDPLVAAATLAAYVEASGAMGAAAVLESGAVVEAEAGGAVTLRALDGEETQPLDAAGAAPLALGVSLRPLPPMEVDPERGEVRGPMGALDHLVAGVRALARALGGRTVALARFPTADATTPFAISARQDEGVVVVLGDEQFEMDPSWPVGGDQA